MQPNVMSIMNLKDNRASLKNTLKWPEPVVHITIGDQHSSRAALLIHFLCCCAYMIEDYLYYLKASLPGSWKSILMHSVLHAYNQLSLVIHGQNPFFKQLWRKQVRGKMLTLLSQSPHPPTKTHQLSHEAQKNLNMTQTLQ